MQPPLEPLEPRPKPTGDCAPYPMEVLTLGGNRWLTSGGRVITRVRGIPTDITPQTLRFWERAARRGGNELSDLIE